MAGLDIYGSETRKYTPNFIVLVDEGQGRPNVAGAMEATVITTCCT